MPSAALVHTILEDTYFLAGIAVAVIAGFGLRQLALTTEQLKLAKEGLQLTQKLAQEGQQREALLLAAQQCRLFADQVVGPAEHQKILRVGMQGKYPAAFLKFDVLKPPFDVTGDNITMRNFDPHKSQEQMTKADEAEGFHTIGLMNAMEAFAIPFAANLATDDVGFYEAAIPFIQLAQTLMPCYLIMLTFDNGRYYATLTVYKRWQTRHIRERLTMIRDGITAQIPK